MSPSDLHKNGPTADHPLAPVPDAEARPDLARTILLALALVVLLAGVVHPLRRYVVEPRRAALLGYHESPGRRLAMASQFGFTTASGASARLVPGRPLLELADLPSQAVTLILGGFRGPYVVWLWIKSEDEKQRKLHFDLVDRYTKIASLQSDYPQIWTFHMWNMAWNLSVQWHSPERKYQWIRRAIEFGEEGYRRNPHSADIMAELGRIYSEKLGQSQEAAYYRRRVQENDGRSTFLIAYEWYDRARKADERWGTLQHGLARPVVYSMACHCVSYYAKELTQEAYDDFQAALKAKQAGSDAEARQAFARGQAKLAAAVNAWKWSRREWQDQIVRWEKEGTSAILMEVYHRFYNEAEIAEKQTEALHAEMTYDNLAETLAKMRRPEIN